jgi:2-methylcitrate dehydratase
MQRVDVERKFRSNVSKRWREARIRSILDALWALDQIDDLGALLGGLTIQAT